jgi:hypothetical protein
VQLFTRYVSRARATFILIGDDLHAYNLIARQRYFEEESAFRIARKQGADLFRMVRRVSRGFKGTDVVIESWQTTSARPEFQHLLDAFRATVVQNIDIASVVQEFVSYHVKRFRWRSDDSGYFWEHRYLIEEMAMSMFVSEKLGYSLEIWEALPRSGLADPIGYLYRERPDVVRSLVGKRHLDRTLGVLALGKSDTI